MGRNRLPRRKKSSLAPEAFVGLALALAACGAEPPRASTVARPAAPLASARDAGVDAQADAPAAAPEAIASAAQIAASGASLAPGMREVRRFDDAAPLELDIVRGTDRDTCARVAFAADAKVRAALVDAAGAPLVELPAASSGVLGTACARRGDAIVLRLFPEPDAGATRARGVAWASP